MEVFLPIAEVSVNLVTIFSLSTIVGVLSGLFGVGGGFLMTPFLIFLGIPPSYAVANEANNILATSVSGSTTHWLKDTLDYRMGIMIVVGGVAGTIIGIITFTYFKEIGKINIVISLSYMYILAIIGTLMLVEGLSEIDRARKKIVLKKKLHSHYWIHGLPLRMRFKKSKLYESAFTPIIIGLIVGFIAGLLVFLSVIFFDRLKIDDPVGAISVHLICGIWGTLAVPLTNPDATFSAQLIGVVSVNVFVFIVSYFIWSIMNSLFGITLSKEAQSKGTDVTETGVIAYAIRD